MAGRRWGELGLFMTNSKILTDEELVEVIRSSDQERYAEIINRYQDRLLRYANYLSGDPAKSADIVQESLIKAFINLNSFNTRKKFSSWIYRIVHNQAMNLFKREKINFSVALSDNIDDGLDLEDELIRKELQQHTKECVQQLPLIYREVLTLFFLESQPYEAISDILKIPMGTVATRINRAKKLMKAICQKNQS